jgi:hypothetical protein
VPEPDWFIGQLLQTFQIAFSKSLFAAIVAPFQISMLPHAPEKFFKNLLPISLVDGVRRPMIADVRADIRGVGSVPSSDINAAFRLVFALLALTARPPAPSGG